MRHGLTFYAEQPGRRLRQIVGDVLVLAWVIAWTVIGQVIYTRAKTQGQGALKLETAGGDFSQSMDDAGSKLRRVPVIGDDIQDPFRKASNAGGYVAQAGGDLQAGTEQLGQILGTLTSALPICLVLAFWAQARWRYAQRVRTARALEGYSGPDIEAVRTLAGLDHAALGLRPHAEARSTTAPTPAVSASTPTVGAPPPPVSAPLPTVHPASGANPQVNPPGPGGPDDLRRPGPPDRR